MFMLRNASKYLFGSTSNETLIEIPQGQLYLVRPISPKGFSELIFRDASASIRRTGQQYQYQLVINRVYEEGEAELAEEEEDQEDAEANGLSSSEKDEKTFLLDESLHLRTERREGGEVVFAWRDLSGDVGDLFEFVCDLSVKPSEVETFKRTAVEAQFERKYRRDHESANEEELEEFTFADEQPIPTASPAKTPAISPSHSSTRVSSGIMTKTVEGDSQAVVATPSQTTAPISRPPPQAKEVLATENAELHLFDFVSQTFILQDALVQARVTDLGNWNYWLQISNEKRDWLGRSIVDDINPVFNFEYLSFIFNQYADDGNAYSWLLRFKTQETLEHFQQGFMQALWENVNQMKWLKAKDDDRQYILDAFQDLTMEDAEAAEAHEDDEVSEDESDDARPTSEHYDSDESQDDVETQQKGKDANSQLAVGYKHDRSFVVRGDKIGVFKHTKDNHLKFDTTISGVKTPKGQAFSPKKVMLHAEDQNMILQNEKDPNSLFRLDLETGKVVDEWKVHDDIPVKTFAPSNKYAQMTNEQTLIGISGNSLYRIDPRLSGNKMVDSDLKQYVSKNDFSAAATTSKGYIAVASNKGDIRMFDRLGINAKTHLPALGESIIGVDVSADGRWVLATTKTYLLLIDALQKDGKNEGKLGFEKSFGKDSKPMPRRLALSPSHVAQMMHETRAPISFTPATFNTGIDSNETTIVTATGPFVVSWSMKKILKGMRDPYSIKRYEEVVKADSFKYGSDKNLIVALPNEVDMVKKSLLKRPTRESIAGPVVSSSSPLKTPAKGTRGSYLKNQVVDSPY